MLAKYQSIAAAVPIKHVIQTDLMDVFDYAEQVPQEQTGIYNLMPRIVNCEQALPPLAVTPDDIALLQYTGGTTGVSKGAMLTHRNIIANALQTVHSAASVFTEQSEIMIQPLPLYHITAFVSTLFMQTHRGNHIVLIPNPSDIDGFVTQLKAHQFTTFCGINTLFVGLCRHPDFANLDFSRFSTTISGGAALTEAAMVAWEQTTGCKIAEGYGLSETSPVIAINNPDDIDFGSVGKEVYATSVKIIGKNNLTCEDGDAGELVVKGPQVMLGYWQRPEATTEAMTEDGYFRTGDIAYRNANGNICIVDRLKDMIIVSGFNVYPNEIEDVLTSHPDILEAAVVGQPDDKTGEQVAAFITVSKDIDTDTIKTYCREQLTAYKIPKQVTIMDGLPKSSVGKILRKQLR